MTTLLTLSRDGLQPNSNLLAMASNLVAMATNLVAMASSLEH